MGGVLSKPKVKDPEPVPEPVDEDAAAIGTARTAALSEARRRSSLMSTTATGLGGLTGRPPTRQGSLLGR